MISSYTIEELGQRAENAQKVSVLVAGEFYFEVGLAH